MLMTGATGLAFTNPPQASTSATMPPIGEAVRVHTETTAW